jgi:DNA-binding transcriptional MerR regulator
MQDDLLPTKAVAELLGCTVATVNRWATEGRLTPAVEMPGKTGARLYLRTTVEDFRNRAAETTKAAG